MDLAALKPMRNLVLVKPVRGPTNENGERVSPGGIVLPDDYSALASWKAVNIDDDFRAEVIAVGPDVRDELIVPGAHVQILAWSDGSKLDGKRRSMYTGEDGPKGTLWVKYPEDFAGFVWTDNVVQPVSGEHAAE